MAVLTYGTTSLGQAVHFSSSLTGILSRLRILEHSLNIKGIPCDISADYLEGSAYLLSNHAELFQISNIITNSAQSVSVVMPTHLTNHWATTSRGYPRFCRL
jgi:hypothetical protein